MRRDDLVVVWDGRRDGPGGALLLPDRDEHPSVLVQAGRRFTPEPCPSFRAERRSARRVALRAAGVDPKTVRYCACGCGQVLPPHTPRTWRRAPLFLAGHRRMGGFIWAARQARVQQESS